MEQHLAQQQKELLGFLKSLQIKLGLTVGEAQQLQATLGAVAQGIGFTQEESADLAIELTKIAADVASFSKHLCWCRACFECL